MAGLSSQLVTLATKLWLDELQREKVPVQTSSDIVEALLDYVEGPNVAIIVVNTSDVRREIVDSDAFIPGIGDDGVSIKNERLMGELRGIPVLASDLGEAMAVVIRSNDQAVYEPSSKSPLSIDLTLGTDWAAANPKKADEVEDLKSKVLVTVDYTFGVEDGDIVVFE